MTNCNCSNHNCGNDRPLQDWEYPDENESTYDSADDSDDYDSNDDSDENIIVRCPQCGTELYDDDTICPKCGQMITDSGKSVSIWVIILFAAAVIGLVFGMISL